MQRETVTWQGEIDGADVSVEIVVQQATYGAGALRAAVYHQQKLIVDALADAPDQDAAFSEMVIRTTVWPVVRAATVSVTGMPWPMTYEQFTALPDSLGVAWENAAYAVNPAWRMQEKKAATEIG